MGNPRGKTVSDIRIRILTFTLLSVSVYLFPQTALPAVFWWLFFSRLSGKQKIQSAAAALLISLLPTVVLLFSLGAPAFVYGGKTAVLLLLAFWFGQTCKAGEFQSFFVWLFGCRIGFDIGMAAEILLMQTSLIIQDAKGYRQALVQKNTAFGPKTLLPFAFGILTLALRRAERSSKLLARRGYVGGGTYKPFFSAEKSDFLRLVFAAGIFLLGVFL